MGEIALPLYLDEGQYGDDPVRLRRPDGSCLCESAESDIDEMREVLTAINDHAALQAQVAALEAERDRLREQVERVRGVVSEWADDAESWDRCAHDSRRRGDRVAAVRESASGSRIRECADRLRTIVGDGDEGEGGGAG